MFKKIYKRIKLTFRKNSKEKMKEKIVTHTAQLAKRQRMFNKSQFISKLLLPLDELRKDLLKT